MCNVNPCLNGGVCSNIGPYSFNCTCLGTFVGRLCEESVSPCARYPCFHNGTCMDDEDGIYTCMCVGTYTGNRCQLQMVECYINPCHNGGTCFVFGKTFKCICPDEFTGHFCDVPTKSIPICINGICDEPDEHLTVDPCMSNPCHTGICIRHEFYRNSTKDLYICQCPPHYKGANCEIKEACADSPCGPHGQCSAADGGNGYLCECEPGYTGENCEHVVSCRDKPCVYGICRSEGDGFICICENGYTGRYCDGAEIHCSSDPCLNKATCVPSRPGYSCLCPATHTGELCEEIITPCSSDPCQNGAICELVGDEGAAHYRCQCRAGYLGKDCEIQDFCHNGPCRNGALCKLMRDRSGFVCDCKHGYTGEMCQVAPTTLPPFERVSPMHYKKIKNIEKKSLETNTPCVNLTCKHGGRCIERDVSSICVCPIDYYGPQCTQPVELNRCQRDSCLHGGICQVSRGQITSTRHKPYRSKNDWNNSVRF